MFIYRTQNYNRFRGLKKGTYIFIPKCLNRRDAIEGTKDKYFVLYMGLYNMFKIGDRVKVIYNSNGSGLVKGAMGQTGIVSRYTEGRMIYVEFGKVVWQTLTEIGFYENEIEPISRKGKQLLLSFIR